MSRLLVLLFSRFSQVSLERRLITIFNRVFFEPSKGGTTSSVVYLTTLASEDLFCDVRRKGEVLVHSSGLSVLR